MIPRPAPAAASPARFRGLWLLAVVLAFWAAQLHGLTHGVSHLGRTHFAPHAAFCSDCLALANAGAAPTPAPSAGPPRGVAPVPESFESAPVRPAAPVAAYRSRAPPTAA